MRVALPLSNFCILQTLNASMIESYSNIARMLIQGATPDQSALMQVGDGPAAGCSL
jgi:hypothetical protein